MSQWPMVKLGELGKWSAGGTPSRKNNHYFGGEIPWASISDLNNDYLDSTEEYLTSAGIENSSAKVYPQDSILIAMYGSIGKTAINRVPMASSQAIACFQPNDEKTDLKYAFEVIKFLRPTLESLGRGGTQKNIGQKTLKGIDIPLPPLEEQRRIAEILKQSSQQISNARQKLDHLLMISLNTMDAHFTAEAVAGDRGWSQIGDFVISTQYGTSKKANETQGIPVLRMGNITYEGELDLKDLKYVELDELERKKFNLKNGDILFNRTNSPELVGKTTVYDSQSEMTFAGYLVRVRTSEDARPEYISGFLNSSYGKAYLRNQAKSIVGMANINAKEFLKIPIPSANESEQGVFSSLYIHCRSQINLVRKKITLLEELHQSLATRAFAGQL